MKHKIIMDTRIHLVVLIYLWVVEFALFYNVHRGHEQGPLDFLLRPRTCKFPWTSVKSLDMKYEKTKIYMVQHVNVWIPIRQVSISYRLGIWWIVHFWNVGRCFFRYYVSVLWFRVWPKPHYVVLHSTWVNFSTCFLECVNLNNHRKGHINPILAKFFPMMLNDKLHTQSSCIMNQDF